MKQNISFLVALLISFLMACGGSSDSNLQQLPQDYSISITGPDADAALVGESVGLVLNLPESKVSQILWTQTAGASLNYLGANRKVIAFDIETVGSYSFNVTFKDSIGGSRSADYTFAATNDSNVFINARLDHEANSKAKMSLRAYDNFPGTLTNVNWTQVSGPAATIQDTQELAIFFTAPEVTQDTLLQFRVEASDDQDNQDSDIINILLEPETINPESHFTEGRFENISLADVYAYQETSPYVTELHNCIYSNSSSDFCNLEQLPFLGSVNPAPTVNEIMDRVLVSHDWMGARFKTFLEQVDVSNDIKTLLGATTSIVISYDIKPSFFWSGTGAIYIDAKYFWVTPQERDTLNETPDFRSEFGKDLQFVDPWRVTKNNDFAFNNPAVESRALRTTQDSEAYVLRVLYHELAHANDFFPPRVWSLASNSDMPWTYSQNNQPDSTGLADSYPLSSQQMYGLGDVMFQGTTASTQQASYTPAQVSDFFFPDNATNTYNYSTEREDYAMLAEEYLMGYRYGVLYDQGITGLAPDYIVSKAERGRVGHARIKPRAEYVVSRILPSIDLQAASASLAAPVELNSGVSWFDTLVAPGQVKQKSQFSRASQKLFTSQDFHLSDDLPIKK